MSSQRGDGAFGPSKGVHTLEEILSQPACWKASLQQLESSGELQRLAEKFSTVQEWLFVGCGSSYYIAQSAAASMALLTGRRSRAIPASEVLLFPQLASMQAQSSLVVLISRSGRTSEVLKAAEQLRERRVPTLGISCAPGQALEKLVDTAIVLPAADEQSMVMTRSFTSMLRALQALAASLARNSAFLSGLRAVADRGETIVPTLASQVHDFVRAHEFADYVCLGQGALYGIACEAALKLTEMSVSYGQSFHTLEFRHGPKSIVGKETLITFLLSETGYEDELQVLEEIKSLGGTTVVIANRADERARRAADLLVELASDGPELARLSLYLPTAQLVGLYTGIKKGHDPDQPRNLSRVVVLQDEASQRKSEHAPI